MNPSHRSLRKSVPSLHGLMLFEASARHLNFSKAAEELAITQSAVSHGVRQLEQALGHALFLRENRSLSLTSQGQRLFGTVARSFASISETVDDISAADQKDTLVVSCSTVLATEWLLPRLPSLREEHPDLTVEIRCLDRDPDLTANGLDVQLRLGDGHWPGLDAVQFWPERIVVVASPDYLRRHGPITALEDLPRHRLIAYIDPHRFRIGWAEWLRAQDVDLSGRLQVILQCNDSLVSLKAAEAGEGLALGWCPLIDRALREGRLVQVLPEALLTGRHHYILTVQNGRRRKVVRQFCDWLLAQSGPGKAQPR